MVIIVTVDVSSLGFDIVTLWFAVFLEGWGCVERGVARVARREPHKVCSGLQKPDKGHARCDKRTMRQ